MEGEEGLRVRGGVRRPAQRGAGQRQQSAVTHTTWGGDRNIRGKDSIEMYKDEGECTRENEMKTFFALRLCAQKLV